MGKIPGFRGVSGSLEGNERGGTLQLNTQNATVEMPLVFRELLQFDVLTAQLGWARGGGETELRLNSISSSPTPMWRGRWSATIGRPVIPAAVSISRAA